MLKSSFRPIVALAALLIFSSSDAGRSSAQTASIQALPDYMDVIVGSAAPSTKSQVAEQNVLALDIAMFVLYDEAQMKFQKNFLGQHPVIMALFSNQGGTLMLYRPGKAPL